jgi:hypothetical protein
MVFTSTNPCSTRKKMTRKRRSIALDAHRANHRPSQRISPFHIVRHVHSHCRVIAAENVRSSASRDYPVTRLVRAPCSGGAMVLWSRLVDWAGFERLLSAIPIAPTSGMWRWRRNSSTGRREQSTPSAVTTAILCVGSSQHAAFRRPRPGRGRPRFLHRPN